MHSCYRYRWSIPRLMGGAAVVLLLSAVRLPAGAQRGGGHFGGGGRASGGFSGVRGGGGSRFGGGFSSSHFGGGSHVGGFAHSGGFDRFGHFDRGRFRGGGTSIFLGFGFGGGYYYPDYYWYPYPYWYPAGYPYPYYYDYPVYADPTVTYVEPRSRPVDTDYYLYRKPTVLPKDPELTAAITDIESGFRIGDIALIEHHVLDSDSISVVSRGHSRESLKGGDYLDKTRDAFKSLKTVRFELGRAEPVDHNDWRVSGTHVFKRDDGKEVRFSVSFVLRKHEDRWVIREVTADPM